MEVCDPMPAINHPAYAEELERCKNTLRDVDKSLETTLAKKGHVDSNLESVRKHFNAENSQDYIDIIVNNLLQGNMDVKLRNLVAAKSRPYFARIDFSEKTKTDAEKLYIGKMSLIRDEDQQLVIVDWRAPVANLYYEGRLGDASYQSPDGLIDGTLKLKRQFSIDKGQLNEIFDIDITTNDEFLQGCLGANADSRLKDIVSTIQTEQNAIVRADMWRPLIVQGAAGSGKTTIALHRIAYLIYSFEKTFKPENFMIIAPNRLFLNYISDVLPELGVEKVRQTTFEEFSQDLAGRKFKLRDANEKLLSFVDHTLGAEEKKRLSFVRRTSEFKASMHFKEALDIYLKVIEENFIPKEDFMIGPTVIYKYGELNELFIKQYSMWPIARRVDEIKKNLKTRLQTRKQSIMNQLHDDSDKRVALLKATILDEDEKQQLVSQTIIQRDYALEHSENLAKKAITDYIKKISKLSPYDYYMDFVNDPSMFNQASAQWLDTEMSGFAQSYTAEMLKSGYLEIEDLAPIIYLKYCIYGMDEKIPVKHVVIDEAQDFSAFQIYVLKRIIKDSSFTILGDLNQGIHSYRGIKDWNELTEHVFSDRKNEFLTLEQSYRTTVEIMDAANIVLDKVKGREVNKGRPVIRHGEEVKITPMPDTKSIIKEIAQNIADFKAQSYKSIAVICKTLKECKDVHAALSKQVDNISLISGKEEVYKSGIVVLPSCLAKGLEFDGVLIFNADSAGYTDDELDIKLLYVAMTRPLHKLYIYHTGELTPLLKP
jgi:DNA helicase II / ATP-dependent DNA helicase PcrA